MDDKAHDVPLISHPMHAFLRGVCVCVLRVCMCISAHMHWTLVLMNVSLDTHEVEFVGSTSSCVGSTTSSCVG